VTPAARTFSMWRLIAALTVMGTLTMATSMGEYAFWVSGFFWAVPLLVAMRCLPLPYALAVVVVSGYVGRGFVYPPDFVSILMGTLWLVPALLVDKLVMARFPRKGIWAWPVAVTATVFAAAAVSGLPIGEAVTLTPVPDIDGAQMAAAGHPALAVFLTAVVANGFAGMAAVLNDHVGDRHPPEVRERGVRVAALMSFALLAAFGVAGLLY
jgi:hypothetical protein